MNIQKKKGFYSCNKVGLHEETFYFLIFQRKATVIKGMGGKYSNFK